MSGMIIRGSGAAGQTIPYAVGRFSGDDDAYVINQHAGVSPFGGFLCSLGSSYALDVNPDGTGRTWCAGSEITLPDGLGKAWYLRDTETGEVWSPFANPIFGAYDEYEVSYLPGQISIFALRGKIACTLTISTVPQHSCELWHVKLENRSAKDRTIEFTTYAEPFIAAPLEVKYLGREKALILRTPLEAVGVDGGGDFVYFQSSTLTPARYQTNRSDFIGDNRSPRDPIHLEDSRSSGTDGTAAHAAASLSVEVELPIEGEAEFGFCFGIANSAEGALQMIRAYKTADNIAAAVCDSLLQWRHACSWIRVESSDRAFDALVNTWLPYEAYSGWLRERNNTAYLDPSQVADLLRRVYPFAATKQDVCRDSLLSFAAGLSLLGAYSPHTGSLVDLPPSELLWLPITATKYVAETGDRGLLDMSIDLRDGPSLTLCEHCERVIRMCLNSPAVNGISDELLDQVVRNWSLIRGEMEEAAHSRELTGMRLPEKCGKPEQRRLPKRAAYFQSISPSLLENAIADVFRLYVGEKDETSNSCAAAAMHAALVERIIGITATVDGLILHPCLPETWIECEVIRRFRGDTYRITLRRATAQRGEGISIVVDGEPVLGDMLPYIGDGGEHMVEVTILGKLRV